MQCRVCDSKTEKAFNYLVLNKHSVNYFHCPNCGILQTEDPYWLNEAYSRPINISDTGLLDRNLYFSRVLSVIIYFAFNKDAQFLDYAGGYGIFTRLMRDIGFDFLWKDPHTQNLLANGFEYKGDSNLKFELITAFEVFEHLTYPKTEIEKMLEITDSIILSTELLPVEIPDPKNWWYFGFEHGQHITFFSPKTFIYLSKKYNLNYYYIDGIILLTKRKLNPSKLFFLKKMRNYGLLQYVKKMMQSKTFKDHLILKESDLN